MSNPWTASTEKAVLYPDDLPGYGPLVIVSEKPIDADDIDHADAGYGSFAALADDHEADWVACPRALRELIGVAIEATGEVPVTIEVTEADRGPEDHDPWKIEGRVIEEGDPL